MLWTLRPLAVSLALAAGVVAGFAPEARAIPEPDRLWLVGERAFQDGLAELSRQSLERFIERFPADPRVPEATLLLGKARLAEGDLVAALDAFRKSAAMAPPAGKPDEARFWEGEALLRLRRHAEARSIFQQIAVEPGSPMAADALYGLAWTELELKRPEAAAQALSRLIDDFPDHASVPLARVQLARTAIGMKKYDEAAAAVQGFAAAYPDHRLVPDARYLLGHAHVSSGQPEGIEELRAFLAAHPGHELAPQARRLLVTALAKGGRRAELADEYKALMTASPPTAEGLYEAGTIAGLVGRRPDADAAWKKLRQGFPDHPLARRAALEQAQGAFDRGAFTQAAALARSAAASGEPAVRASALLLAGESELKRKRWAPAHQAFRAAAEAAGADAGIRYRALAGSGLAMEEQQRWADAARYYQQVAESSPDSELRKWARTRRTAVTSEGQRSPSAPATKPKPAPSGAAPKEPTR